MPPDSGSQRQAMDTSTGSTKRPGEKEELIPADDRAAKVLVTSAPEDWADADPNVPAKTLEAARWQAA